MSSDSPPATPSRPGILIVDDNALVGRMLAAALDASGFAAYPTESGSAAIERFDHLSPAPVMALLDVYMHGLDGLETLRRLRERDPALPCCFMTGYGGSYTVQQLLDRGAAHVFLKPFHVRRLTDALRRLVFGSAPVESVAGSPEVERRRFPRWEGTPFEVAVTTGDTRSAPRHAVVCDRSLGGVCLMADAPWPAGTQLQLSRKTIGAKAQSVEVRHSRPAGDQWAVGCRFTAPPPLQIVLAAS
ncbi:MAG: response regulator [Gemmataceae bacterium]